MTSRTVKLMLAQGLHLRACSKVVALANGHPGRIQIRHGDKSADARSIFDLIQLAAPCGSLLILDGDGADADALLDALEQFFSLTTEPEDG